MQKSYAISGVVVILISSLSGVKADRATDRKQLAKQYAQMYSFWSQQDAPKLRSWFEANSTQDFTSVDPSDQRHSRQEMIAEISAVKQRPDIQSMHFRYTIDSVTITSHTATVYVTEVRTEKEDEAKKKSHIFTIHLQSIDTWVQSAGKWKWRQRQPTPLAPSSTPREPDKN